MEGDGADDWAPEGALAAQKHADHHEDAKVDGLIGGLQWFKVDELEGGDRAGDADEESRDGPRDELVAHGVQTHRLGLFLVIPDGVQGGAKAGLIEPFEEDEEHDAGRGEEEIDHHLEVVEIAGIAGHGDALAAADPIPVRHHFARSDSDAERADGEVRAAQAEGDIADDQSGNGAEYAGADGPKHQPAEILPVGEGVDPTASGGRVFPDRVGEADRDHGGDIHPRSVKEDVAERVVAHLPASHVPGQRDDDEEPESRQRRRVIGEEKWRRDRGGDQYDVEDCLVHGPSPHLSVCRFRRCCIRRQTRTMRRRRTAIAC